LNSFNFNYKYQIKEFDKKKNPEVCSKDLFTDLKDLIKLTDSLSPTSVINGWGEGVCIVINDLLNKYLINEGFEFLNPKHDNEEQNQIDDNLPDINVEEITSKEGIALTNNNLFTNSVINDEEFFEKNNNSNKIKHNSANSNQTGKKFLIRFCIGNKHLF